MKVDDRIRILVECKPISTALDKAHLAQLYRYFSVTSARFALLTNGRTFSFYTDLEEPNKLDTVPFLSFDISDLQPGALIELKKFSREEFDFESIRASASRLKYVSELKRRISHELENPNEDIVRLLVHDLYQGRFTMGVFEQFAPLVKVAFRDLIRESVHNRLSSALADTQRADEIELPVEDVEEEIVTTPEEIEGFMIVKAIVREVIKPERVFIRDQKSYCGILADNNNRKPLARLHFNRATKYVSLFDSDKEDRVRIQTLDDIYDLADRLKATAKQYLNRALSNLSESTAPVELVEGAPSQAALPSESSVVP